MKDTPTLAVATRPGRVHPKPEPATRPPWAVEYRDNLDVLSRDELAVWRAWRAIELEGDKPGGQTIGERIGMAPHKAWMLIASLRACGLVPGTWRAYDLDTDEPDEAARAELAARIEAVYQAKDRKYRTCGIAWLSDQELTLALPA
jgi:hypothetical protein